MRLAELSSTSLVIREEGGAKTGWFVCESLTFCSGAEVEPDCSL